MKNNQHIKTIYIGERKLEIIEGLTIKKYLPESIMDNVHIALKDREMKWNNDVIKDCTMVISSQKYVSMMYKYDALFFKGLLLFTYCIAPELGHRFSFALKGKHIEYYTRRNK